MISRHEQSVAIFNKLTKKIFKAGLRLLQFDILKERNLNADINAAKMHAILKYNLYTLKS